MSKQQKDKIYKILVAICIIGSACTVAGLALVISRAQVAAGITFAILFGGIALCFGSGMWILVRTLNRAGKERPKKGRLTTDFKVPQNTEKGVYMGTKVPASAVTENNKSEYEHYGDVTVVPIDYSEEWWEESENCLKNFLDNVKYPEGFEEFLKEYGQFDPYKDSKWKKAKRIFINENIDDDKKYYIDKYFELHDIDSPETLRQTNENILLSCEFYAQFRKILIFAGDASGESFFFLDYGKGGEPSVKYFADGVDVYLLANSFKEFKDKLVTAKEAGAILGDEYYGDIDY